MKLSEIDQKNLDKVLERIDTRMFYIAVNKRLQKSNKKD